MQLKKNLVIKCFLTLATIIFFASSAVVLRFTAGNAEFARHIEMWAVSPSRESVALSSITDFTWSQVCVLEDNSQGDGFAGSSINLSSFLHEKGDTSSARLMWASSWLFRIIGTYEGTLFLFFDGENKLLKVFSMPSFVAGENLVYRMHSQLIKDAVCGEISSEKSVYFYLDEKKKVPSIEITEAAMR